AEAQEGRIPVAEIFFVGVAQGFDELLQGVVRFEPDEDRLMDQEFKQLTIQHGASPATFLNPGTTGAGGSCPEVVKERWKYSTDCSRIGPLLLDERRVIH